MTRIEKKIGFYKKNIQILFGIFWLCIALFMFLIAEEGKYIAPSLYLVGGILYIFAGFNIYKKRNSEYVAWNVEELIVAQLFSKPMTYPVDEHHSITVSEKHLTVKAPKAKGVMLDLKGFAAADIKKLQARFAAGPVLTSF